jgi:hypothetical protein
MGGRRQNELERAAEDLRARLTRGLEVRCGDDPVEAFAKRRLVQILQRSGQPGSTPVGDPARERLLERLETQQPVRRSPWRRDALYSRPLDARRPDE